MWYYGKTRMEWELQQLLVVLSSSCISQILKSISRRPRSWQCDICAVIGQLCWNSQERCNSCKTIHSKAVVIRKVKVTFDRYKFPSRFISEKQNQSKIIDLKGKSAEELLSLSQWLICPPQHRDVHTKRIKNRKLISLSHLLSICFVCVWINLEETSAGLSACRHSLIILTRTCKAIKATSNTPVDLPWLILNDFPDVVM